VWDEKKRTANYDNLTWVKDQDYLKHIVKMCDLKKGMKVCDVGTGTGVVAEALSHSGAHVDAIDNSKVMLEMAKRNRSADNITYMLEDIQTYGPENTYDRVVARMVFHHVDDDKKAIQNCMKMLKPDGRLIIAEGTPPRGAKHFFTKMMAIKEKRRTYDVDDLVVLMDGFKKVDLDIFVTKDMSIKNWLDNSGLKPHEISEIKRLHIGAPKHVCKAYNMRLKDADIIMDWEITVISGVKA